MSDETIIKNWRIGLTVKSIAKKYKEEENKKRKQEEKTIMGTKITDNEAFAYVERIIYKYQTELMKGGQA